MLQAAISKCFFFVLKAAGGQDPNAGQAAGGWMAANGMNRAPTNFTIDSILGNMGPSGAGKPFASSPLLSKLHTLNIRKVKIACKFKEKGPNKWIKGEPGQTIF